jgi:hypothetical protein
VVPACIIQPVSPQEVSIAIQMTGKYECHSAVKSGGHARSVGASNADGGITFDLKCLNGIQVSEDRQTTYVGTANRWGSVYNSAGNSILAVNTAVFLDHNITAVLSQLENITGKDTTVCTAYYANTKVLLPY